ncbi:craniofacial development protein 2-like [Nylanderia fulva]|uniref:craniofacial development protein 2-like n=1 Tax=Nylanderia fulva TaxID=613905 RepID=UPI0010FBA106|nr:craniofacial development protein 2-like [Nylanderia fulva]
MEESDGKPLPLPPSQENHMTAFNSKYSGGLNSSPIGSPGGTDLSEVKSADIRKKINIGTWNVQSLFEAGKLANLIQEMKRLDIDIMGVAETWWPDAEVCSTGGGAFYYSGNQDKNHRKGVGIIVSDRFKNCIIDFIPYSDRIALIKINARPTNLNIIQIYAPTADAPDEEMEIFYEQIKEMLKLTKKHDMNIIMGDFNSRIGKERYEDLVGPFGLGIRNERGERLVQFCQEEDMRVTNTWYQLPPRRLYTWRSPRDSPENISRNQIDFILINKRFGSSINRVSTYPGADVPSDHILLRATIKIKLTKYVKPVSKRGIAYKRLKQGDIKAAMRHEINNNIEEMLSSRRNEHNPTKI